MRATTALVNIYWNLAGIVLSVLCEIYPIMLHNHPAKQLLTKFAFTDEETEAQEEPVACPRFPNL